MRKRIWNYGRVGLLCILCLTLLLTGCGLKKDKPAADGTELSGQERFLIRLADSLTFDFENGTFSYCLPKAPKGWDYAIEQSGTPAEENPAAAEAAVLSEDEPQDGDRRVERFNDSFKDGNWTLTLRLIPKNQKEESSAEEWREGEYSVTLRSEGICSAQCLLLNEEAEPGTVPQYADWRCAYKDLIETMAADGCPVSQYVLYNVNKGAPELFLGDGTLFYVFTFEDGMLRYLGDVSGIVYEARGEEKNDFYTYGAYLRAESDVPFSYRAWYYHCNDNVICCCDDEFSSEGLTNQKGTKLTTFRINGESVGKSEYEKALKEKFKYASPLTVHSLEDGALETLAFELANVTPTGKFTMTIADQRAKAYCSAYATLTDASAAPAANPKLYGDLPWMDLTGYTVESYSFSAEDDYHLTIFYTLRDAYAHSYVMGEQLTFENTGQTWIQEDWRVSEWAVSPILLLDEEGKTEEELFPEESEEEN